MPAAGSALGAAGGARSLRGVLLSPTAPQNFNGEQRQFIFEKTLSFNQQGKRTWLRHAVRPSMPPLQLLHLLLMPPLLVALFSFNALLPLELPHSLLLDLLLLLIQLPSRSPWSAATARLRGAASAAGGAVPPMELCPTDHSWPGLVHHGFDLETRHARRPVAHARRESVSTSLSLE